jgi:DNA-binding NtrC family response regulator
VIITGHADVETAVKALKMGATDFLLKPVKLVELDGVLEKAVRVRGLRRDRHRLRETIRGIQASEGMRRRDRLFVGESAAAQKIRSQIRQAAAAACDTVLITGDTGTGKEVAAREIHFSTEDEGSPFIAVSCPALPDTLVESELFGHVKGSFTGATADRAGYFELADGGTLFLDEIADLSASAQAVLLRVLETRAFRRVGGSKETSVSLRVIAATNAQLERLVEKGKFRQDLFYRLNVFRIHLPPLRERREDVIPLAEHFRTTYTQTRGLGCGEFAPEARDLLLEYEFPGNARELRNIVERAVILCRGSNLRRIEARFLVFPDLSGQPPPQDERERIVAALEKHKWNRRRAAETLGMPYSTLRYKMDKLNIGRD